MLFFQQVPYLTRGIGSAGIKNQQVQSSAMNGGLFNKTTLKLYISSKNIFNCNYLKFTDHKKVQPLKNFNKNIIIILLYKMSIVTL